MSKLDMNNMESWGFDEYAQYFESNRSIFNSTLFKNIQNTILEIPTLQNQNINEENARKIIRTGDKLLDACESYLQEKKMPKSEKGNERLNVVKNLQKFYQNYAEGINQLRDVQFLKDKEGGLELNNDLEIQQSEINTHDWKMDKYANYLERNRQWFGNNSKSLESLVHQLRTLHSLQNEDMTEDNAKKFLNACDLTIKNSISYIDEKGSDTSLKGKECLKVVNGLLNFWSKYSVDNNLDQLRDPNVIREYRNTHDNKKWINIDPISVAKAEIKETAASVGESASERYEVEYGKKKGFFTPEQRIKTPVEIYNDVTKDEENPERKNVLKECLNTFIADNLDAVDRKKQVELYPEEKEKLSFYNEAEKIPSKEERDSFKKTFITCYGDLNNIRNGYKTKLRELEKTQIMDESQKKQLLTELIDNHKFNVNVILSEKERKDLNEEEKKALREERRKEISAENRKAFTENRDKIFQFVNRQPQEMKIVGVDAQKKYLDLLLYQAIDESPKDKIELYRKFLGDPQTKNLAIKIIDGISASYNMQMPELGSMEVGSEMSGRNVVSSRLAEACGVGNILAHSEPMIATVKGKQVRGCFMEFAEGIDMRHCKGKDLEVLNKVEFKNTSGFTKDMCHLEILDFICAQADRHAGNIFLKLDENHRPIGLQGIDNDVSLSDYSKKNNTMNIPMKQGELSQMHFIGREMADKIQALKPEDLEYLAGDKLNQSEVEALVGRVQHVQEHIRNNMFIVENDEGWELEDYSKLSKPEGMDEKQAKDLFKQAKFEIEDGWNIEEKDDRNLVHQNTNIANEILKARARYNESVKKTIDTLKDDKSLEEKSEAEKKSLEEEPKPDSIKKTAEAVSEKEHESKENEKTETQKEAPENDVKKEANSAKAIPPRPGFRRGVGVGAVIAGKTPEEIKELTKDLTIGEDGLIRRKDELKSKKESWVSGKKEHLKDTPQRDIKMGARRTTQKSNPMGNHAETVPEKTTATVENLKEDGTEKIKTYEDGSKVKIVSSSDGQFIRSEGFRKRDDKRKAMNLTELVKSFSEQTKAVQRDADERKQQRDEAKKAAQIQNELDNPILDEMGYDRGFVKTKEKLENPWSIMKNASRTTRAQMELADKKRNANEKKAEGKDSKFEDTRSKKDIAKNGGRQM